VEMETGTPGPTPRPRPEAASEEVEDRDPKAETEPERLVRSLTTGDQHQVSPLMNMIMGIDLTCRRWISCMRT
jgi:hypothetical protein